MADKGKITIAPEQIATTLAGLMEDYVGDVGAGVKKKADERAKEGVKLLKEASPINPRSGRVHYKTQWRSKTTFEGRQEKRNTIHNLDYRLPHLLERPHQLRKGGRIVGHTKGQPHIEPIEKYLIDEFEKDVEEVIKNGGL